MRCKSLLMGLVLGVMVVCGSAWGAGEKPNVIFILADDLGYGDIGAFGQTKIKTPNLDRMAAEGTRFTHAYVGTSVCAPSRCSLMTGLHMGHAPIRANKEMKPEGQMPLPEGTYTVAQLFKSAGYATGTAGKWGLGMFDTPGSPLKVGFDHFFGYNCQAKAHEYFPPYLYNDDKRIELDGKTYSQNLIANDALSWVRAHKDEPFFYFYALTLPHGKFEIDDLGEYAKEDWPAADKAYAAMVTRMDRDIGRMFALLKELGIDEKTLVIFASDNGPAREGIFNSHPGLRGIKRSMYEGGLRTPTIVRWPGKAPAGKVSDGQWAFWDFLPTMAELTGQKIPEGVKVDGIPVLSGLLGGEMPKREYFYWELHEVRTQQAVRFGDWKAVKTSPSAAVELYNLKDDPSEKNNLAKTRPEELKKGEELLRTARVDDPNWPVKEGPAGRRNGNRRAGNAGGRQQQGQGEQ